MFIKSIRGRLLLWLALLLACILAGFGVTAYQLQRISRLKQIDDEFLQRVAALSDDVLEKIPSASPTESPPPDENVGPDQPSNSAPTTAQPGENPRSRVIRLSARTRGLFNPLDADGFYFAIWSRDGDLLKYSVNIRSTLKMPARSMPDTVFRARTLGQYHEGYRFTEMGECVLVGRNIAADLAAMERWAVWLVAAGVAVLALGLGMAGWLVSRALRPVKKISDTASGISGGNLSGRINVTDTDSELGQLAGTLNSTFARLEATFAQQKHFTADAAHELRTPITVLISEAQTTLTRERNSAEYRETIGGCLETAQQMRKLTDSLLQLARLDAGQEAMERTSFDLAETTRASVNLLRPLALQRGVQIHCDLAPVQVSGNTERLGQVIANLLTNAVQYNKPNGEVRITTRVQNGICILTVSDTGAGISSEDLPRVFERFYRADKSRSGSNGHSGLGLAICKAVVEAHGGTISVSSEPDMGSTFTVRLPASSQS